MKKELPASVEELLVWHQQYHIRGVQIPEPEVENWLPTLAALNLRLKALDEPIWKLCIIEPPTVDLGKRFAFFRQKPMATDLHTGRAITGMNARKKLWSNDSWFNVQLDKTLCILCTACNAVCQEGAIIFGDNQIEIDNTKCSGCMACRDVCMSKAIAVEAKAEKDSNPVHYHYFDATCTHCRLSFITWQPENKMCSMCYSRQEKG